MGYCDLRVWIYEKGRLFMGTDLIHHVGLCLDALKAVCKDIKALLLYPGFIGVSPAAETSCYMDLIPFLEGGKIVTGLSFPGGDLVPGGLDDRTAFGLLVGWDQYASFWSNPRPQVREWCRLRPFLEPAYFSPPPAGHGRTVKATSLDAANTQAAQRLTKKRHLPSCSC